MRTRDARHWKKKAGGDGFTYEDCENYDEYCVDCSLYSEHAYLEYSIDEDDDIMLFLIIYIGFLFSPLVGVICVVLYMAIKEFIDERYRQDK